MFLTLLKKECLSHLKSVTYYIFLACLILDFLSQMGEFESIIEPVPGKGDYGLVRSDNPELIMQDALDKLIAEWQRGEYTTYPIGFYKRVVPDEDEQKQVEESIVKITGMSREEIEEAVEKQNEEWAKMLERVDAEQSVMVEGEEPELAVTVADNISYQEFLQEMKKIDDLLGGGSDYSENNLQWVSVPETYEQAKAGYDSLIKDDKVSNAYARLFCDYLGIMLAILPVFLAVTRSLRDKKAQAEQVIYMHRASSFSVIISRFLAEVLAVVLPVILLSCYTLSQVAYYAASIHAKYDILAFVKYIGFWLLPTILVSLAVGFFLTELTDSAIAILVQGVWWFVSIFMSIGDLVGTVGWNLVPRFNTVGSYDIYVQIKSQLIYNRIVYAVTAMVLILLTVWVYSKKRKGELVSVGTMLRNRKNKLEA